MPNKRTKNASKSTSNTKNQPNISKYFTSDSSYPTSFLRKRHPEADKVSLKLKISF